MAKKRSARRTRTLIVTPFPSQVLDAAVQVTTMVIGSLPESSEVDFERGLLDAAREFLQAVNARRAAGALFVAPEDAPPDPALRALVDRLERVRVGEGGASSSSGDEGAAATQTGGGTSTGGGPQVGGGLTGPGRFIG